MKEEMKMSVTHNKFIYGWKKGSLVSIKPISDPLFVSKKEGESFFTFLFF